MVLEIKPDEKKYRVNWSKIEENINELYLIITAESKIKVIEDGKLSIKDTDFFPVLAIHLPRVGNLSFLSFPNSVRNAKFSFVLARDEMGMNVYEKYEKIVYIGDKETLGVSAEDEGQKMKKVEFSCRFQLDKNMFGLTFGSEQDYPYITLLEMKKENGKYRTSCYLRKEAYERMNVAFANEIADFMQYKKR